MTRAFPPRLHVLLARDGKSGVVIRRGPSKTTCAIGWDRGSDTFSVGQWMRGRIYERRSDLSPDGKHLIYFAMNGRWQSATKGSWTAISRAPYLHAVTLLAKGDCWHGGGLFVDRKHYWLNDGYGHQALHDSGEVERAMPPPYRPTWGGECPGVYYNRLVRDGWTLREDLGVNTRMNSTDVWERPLSHGWVLRKIAHAQLGAPPGKSVYYDEHELIGHGRELARPDWEWADVDGKRIVWASGGMLHAGYLSRQSSKLEDPVAEQRMLHDFNGMTFQAIAAPYDRDAPPNTKSKRKRD